MFRLYMKRNFCDVYWQSWECEWFVGIFSDRLTLFSAQDKS